MPRVYPPLAYDYDTKHYRCVKCGYSSIKYTLSIRHRCSDRLVQQWLFKDDSEEQK